MKRLSKRSANQAMTLIEVLAVIAVIVLVVAMLVPLRPHTDGSKATACRMRLKQIDLGFQMYAEDNGGKFPIQVSITNGGTMEYLERNQTFPHYQKLAPYIQYSKVLWCPLDKNRHAATDYATLTDANLSYFLNADVSTNNPSVSIMTGDRNLETNGRPIPAGLFTLTTNTKTGWTQELHPKGGNLGFADGHVEFCRSENLTTVAQNQNLVVSRLSIP